MRKIVLAMIGMMTLCVHSAELEEAKRLVREYVEQLAELDKQPTVDFFYYVGFLEKLAAFDRDVQMSVYLDMLEENPDDPATINLAMFRFNIADRGNYTPYRNQKALDWVRKVLKSEDERFDKKWAGTYLLGKGDAGDLDIIGDEFRERLAMRVAGTNLINYSQNNFSWYGCFLSVTNTGYQGLYVQEILRQVWENLEEETHSTTAGFPRHFKDKSKIPDELITMVVWFDDDGNPVCNVDLEKYGLTMPEIDLPQNVRDEILRRARPNVATASLPLTEDEVQRLEAVATKPNRLWLYTAILAILCATVALWLIRKRK